MTYVSDMNSEELAAHMTRLQATPGWHNPLDDRLWQEVKSLRAELAEVKGREAVPVAWAAQNVNSGKYGYIWHEESDVCGWINLQHQSSNSTWRGPIALYTTPPAATSEAQANTSEAAPGVVGLVKALEAAFPLLDDSGLDETRHHCEWNIQQERKRLHAALSAWRQTHTPSTLPASSAEE